jgi:Flp pilus assembly secretin CpaC
LVFSALLLAAAALAADAVAPVLGAAVPTAEWELGVGRSKLLRAETNIVRVFVADSTIADVVQVSPREVMLMGKAEGRTDVTIWLGDPTPRTVILVLRVSSEDQTPSPAVAR